MDVFSMLCQHSLKVAGTFRKPSQKDAQGMFPEVCRNIPKRFIFKELGTFHFKSCVKQCDVDKCNATVHSQFVIIPLGRCQLSKMADDDMVRAVFTMFMAIQCMLNMHLVVRRLHMRRLQLCQQAEQLRLARRRAVLIRFIHHMGQRHHQQHQQARRHVFRR